MNMYNISPETKSTIQQLVRICAYFGSAWLIKSGVSQDQFVELASGAVIGVTSLGYWLYWQINRKPD